MKKVVVVTGGSRGIGAATARLAAARGYAVCVNYRNNEAAAASVVREITAVGGKAIAVAADVGREADVIRLFERVDDDLGLITALVNNAGMLERQTRVEHMDAARLSRVLATNVVGSFLCAREAVRRMSTRYGGSGGAIVNVSSVASRLGAPNEYVDYAAAKGAIDTFTIGLAKEVAAESIRVNAVRPGIIHTDIHASGESLTVWSAFKPRCPCSAAGMLKRSLRPSCGSCRLKRRTLRLLLWMLLAAGKDRGVDQARSTPVTLPACNSVNRR